MGRRKRSVVKRSRALGIPLSPKAARIMENRPFRPGQHGRARIKISDYKTRLLEKQRLRAQYAIGERQLRNAVAKAARRPGRTGEELLVDLETRLDALVLRAGLARTIWQARQHVSHGHIRVDGAKVDRPSYRVRPGQVIEVAERSRHMLPFQIAATGEYAATHPPYLSVDRDALRARLERPPTRSEIPVVCDETKVVEFYAR
ncbi:MAG TPA: 30S ribosomal protein S4 [Natronosporangium sp.]|nr:30S ribosomal protein S4 [Natronosporangium sp.]